MVHSDTGHAMAGPKVYMVGGPMIFSDVTLRVAQAEFTEYAFERVNTVDAFCEAINSTDAETAVVLVGQTYLSRLIENWEAIQAKFPNTIFALAYTNDCTAQELLRTQSCDSKLADIRLMPMNVQFDQWFALFRLVLGGHNYIPQELATGIVAQAEQEPHDTFEVIPLMDHVAAAQSKSNAAIDKLTARESEVLHLVSEGKQNKIIAEELNLSEHTVKLHIHHVIAKLGVHNRTEAAIIYLSNTEDSRGQVGEQH